MAQIYFRRLVLLMALVSVAALLHLAIPVNKGRACPQSSITDQPEPASGTARHVHRRGCSGR